MFLTLLLLKWNTSVLHCFYRPQRAKGFCKLPQYRKASYSLIGRRVGGNKTQTTLPGLLAEAVSTTPLSPVANKDQCLFRSNTSGNFQAFIITCLAYSTNSMKSISTFEHLRAELFLSADELFSSLLTATWATSYRTKAPSPQRYWRRVWKYSTG